MIGGNAASTRRVMAVDFHAAVTWNVAAQFAKRWKWPIEVILPLKLALQRRSNGALEMLAPETEVTLLTIRFDGTIEPREAVKICDVKGKLFRVLPGNVVFSKIDVRNGAIGLAPDIENMCVTSEFPIYDVKSGVADPKYIKLLFRTQAFKTVLNSMISGTSGRKRIQPSQLENVRVPLPKANIQNKIVSYWEAGERIEALLRAKAVRLVRALDAMLVSRTKNYQAIVKSKMFAIAYDSAGKWDMKAGRAAAFNSANPNFVRLGDYTEECIETLKPWEKPEKDWPVYGVNNKEGVFLNSFQIGKEFNAPYKRIEKGWFFHNPTRANVGSLGIVPDVPDDALTSPEYQVWRLIGGFLPTFMSVVIQTDYFLSLVAFNRVGGVKQRMYYANLAEIRLPVFAIEEQQRLADEYTALQNQIHLAKQDMERRKAEVEKMILGDLKIEGF
jgi:restriction endonuclease S subunit